jgi:hypothetical protein
MYVAGPLDSEDNANDLTEEEKSRAKSQKNIGGISMDHVAHKGN